MTRRRPASATALLQLAGVAAGVVALAAVLGWLNATAPVRTETFVVEGTEVGDEVPFVTCQRREPGRATVTTEGQAPVPLGRVRSTEVVGCPDVFDGEVVRFVGEVVGDVLERDGGAWVLMNDDPYGLELGPLPAHRQLTGTNTGLTVWLPDEVVDLSDIEPGRPGRRGDVLAVRGRLLRTDPADGGGLTLRAVAVEVVADAAAAQPPFRPRQAALAGVLAVGAVAVTWYERRQRYRV